MALKIEIGFDTVQEPLTIFRRCGFADMSHAKDLAPQWLKAAGDHHLPFVDQIPLESIDIHFWGTADSRNQWRGRIFGRKKLES